MNTRPTGLRCARAAGLTVSLAAVNLCVLLTAACANTPVLVYAMGHLRAAAVVAERLSDDGHSRVWVVTN